MSITPDIMDPALVADPFDGYDRIREEGPVLRGRFMDGSPAWYVTRARDVRAVLADPRFVNDPASVPGAAAVDRREGLMRMFGIPAELAGVLTGSILNADGADHVRLRTLVSRAFTVRRVAAMRPRVEDITAALLDAIDGSVGPVDLVETLAYPLPITVICELVGIPEVDRADWHRWGADLVSMDPARLPGALRETDAHIRGLIAARRAQPADDLITGLVRAQDDDGDRLTDDEMISLVLALVFAGHETTAHLIANGIDTLLRHPDQLALLRAEPARWPAAVEELMRRDSPVHVTQLRYAAADVELAGVQIAAGDAVQLVLVSANRDPRVHDRPGDLDVTRRPAARGEGHLGFGHGPHFCLGAALARQEAEVTLSALFTRFPGISLVDQTPRWVPMPGQHRLAALPVRLG